MALFNKEAERNVKADTTPRLAPQSQAQPMVVTTAPVVINPAPEKSAAPVRPVPTPIEARANSDGRAYLDGGTKISGKLLFEGPTRIDGQVDGELAAKESLI